MGKPAGRYRLDEVVRELREEEPGVEIEAADGSLFAVPPPELWPDEAITLATEDPVGAARALLGKQYDAFVEAGGSAAVLFHIIGKEAGIPTGESSPS